MNRAEASLHRRDALRMAASACSACLLPARGARAAPPAEPPKPGLGFSLYGMRSLPLAEALATLAQIGYECTELPVMPDWPGDSRRMTHAQRQTLRHQLTEHRLRLSALMENLPLAAVDDETPLLDRLRHALTLASELTSPMDSPGAAGEQRGPVVETILGGRPGSFEDVKERLAERLHRWAEVAADGKVVVAIKAHVSNAVQRPEQLIWLVEQVASPWLKAAYDYSHYQVQGLGLAETLQIVRPHLAFVHVKDGESADGRTRFLLPGEGRTDYAQLWQRLLAWGYRGDVVVEVSSQISTAPGYDPLTAARQCYLVLSRARQQALARGTP